ncbi:MAG: hypothetical protein ACYDAA_12590 [Syntrophales bacterium]
MKQRFSQNKGRFLQTGSDPDVIERKSGGGVLTFFGIPFFLAGLWVFLIGLGLGPTQASGGFPGSAAAVLVGLIFTAIGGMVIFGRSGLIIDRRENRVVQWQGLLVPLRRTVRPLDSFDGVRIDCNRGDKTTTYPVQLRKGSDARGAITIEAPADYQRARRSAETLARFVRMPLEDHSSGKPVIRDPDHLDESLRERVRRLGEEQGFFPPQPVPMRTKVEQTVDGVILSIPHPTFGMGRRFRLVVALIVAGFAALVVLPALLSLPMPPPVQYLIIGFVLFFSVLLPLGAALRSSAGSSRVTVTRAFLRVEEGRTGKNKTIEIPADELEELEYADRRAMLNALDMSGMKKLKDFGDTGTPRLPDGRPVPKIVLKLARLVPSHGITARSDRAAVTFGKGLPDEELAYLHFLVRKILTD